MDNDHLNQVHVEPLPPWYGRATVFQMGRFLLRSGVESAWKIEGDNLTPGDWNGLAAIAMTFLPPFGKVLGVPRGGFPFADALRRYQTHGHARLLLAADVLTSGGSLIRYRDNLGLSWKDAIAVVAFARGKVPDWVFPVFTLYGC